MAKRRLPAWGAYRLATGLAEMITARRCVILLALLYLSTLAGRVYVRKMHLWLPDYVRQQMIAAPQPASGPVHVFFLYVDHFEPGKRFDRTERWAREYPPLANRHRDSTGRPVQHSWFYPGEAIYDENLKLLRELVVGGYGEVEFHYHHGNDTQESTKEKFSKAVSRFQKYGFLLTTDGQTRFAFAHGNWSLDNSRGKQFCGADRELQLLREMGCFADFTFPSLWQDSQPWSVNQIYMATDDDQPKSYDEGRRVKVGGKLEGDLMIFEGPLLPRRTWDPTRHFFRVEDGNVHVGWSLDEARVDAWVRANVHVEGKPEWVFVKIHGHSVASDGEMAESLGPPFERALAHLEKRYNDGVRYRLHYVTAREAYNLVRAAAEGNKGDPQQYYDWVIKPYVANGSRREMPGGSGGGL